MKKHLRLLALALVLLAFSGMALGSASETPADTQPISTSKPSSSDSGNEAPEAPAIEEQLLLEWEGIKITAKEYTQDSIWGDGIKVLIENDSDKSVGVGCSALIVNNYMLTDFFSETVAAGKKSNTTIHLSSQELEAAGIENVGQVELYFHFFDPDTYLTTYEADCVTVQTSNYASMDTTPADIGTELYNQGGIRIVGKYVDEGSFWGAAVLLYLENTSGQDVIIQCDDMSINGFMVTPLFSSTVFDGKMALDDITIFESDLEENDITSVEEIELVFKVLDPDTYQTIAETDPITFSAAG